MVTYGSELARVTVRWGPAGSSEWAEEMAVTSLHLEHIHFTGNTFDWPSEIQHLTDNLYSKFVSHWDALAPFHASRGQIKQFRAAHIDAAGHTLHEGVTDVAPEAPLVGSASGSMLPPEVALAVSLWGYAPGTFTPQKARKRSRFYLPYLAASLSDASGKVDADKCDAVLAAWKSLTEDVQGMHASGGFLTGDHDYWAVVAASGVDGSKTQVGWISVDNHFDSQRRRQHQDTPVRHTDTISHA